MANENNEFLRIGDYAFEYDGKHNWILIRRSINKKTGNIVCSTIGYYPKFEMLCEKYLRLEIADAIMENRQDVQTMTECFQSCVDSLIDTISQLPTQEWEDKFAENRLMFKEMEKIVK
jgi:hypothetical protein